MAPKAPSRPRSLILAATLVALFALAFEAAAPTAEVHAQSCDVTPPANLSFGSVVIGEFKDLDIVLENTGLFEISGTVDVPCDDFSLLDADPTFLLAGGDSDTFTVRFAPTSIGRSLVLPSHSATAAPSTRTA